MKKIICLLLAVLMITALFTGCGKKKDKIDKPAAAATEPAKEVDLEELTAAAKSDMPELTDAADFARRYGKGLTESEIDEFMAFMKVCRDTMNDEVFCAAMKVYLNDTKDVRKAIATMFSDGLSAAATMKAEEAAVIAGLNIKAASLNVDVPTWTIEYLGYKETPEKGDLNALTEDLTAIVNGYAQLFYGQDII